MVVGALDIHEHVDVDLIGDEPLALAKESQNFPESNWLLFFFAKDTYPFITSKEKQIKHEQQIGQALVQST